MDIPHAKRQTRQCQDSCAYEHADCKPYTSSQQYFTNWIEKSFRKDEIIISSISVTDIVFYVHLGK